MLTDSIPGLAGHPRVPIVAAPTAVRRLGRAFPNDEVWLKDDSTTSAAYGGNKPRKLEYLIADARRRRSAVVTFGYETSNHALATAVHCRAQGVPCHLVLLHGPVVEPSNASEIAEKRRLLDELATSVRVVPDLGAAVRAALRLLLRSMGRMRVIPPGGSNALGTLGYVAAAAELAGQVSAGELPEPRFTYVPLGTGGTAVGLAIGARAAGLRGTIVAVRVVPRRHDEPARLRALAARVKRLLPGYPSGAFDLANLKVDDRFLGRGYGWPVPEGSAAIRRWNECERIALEETYSGKAAAALDADSAAGAASPRRGGPALFWLTYCAPRRSPSVIVP